MIVASWNVNSIRVRLDAVLDWAEAQSPDILCLQETKVTDDLFPFEAFEKAGYQSFVSGQKTYNGVSIHVKTGRTVDSVQKTFASFGDDPEKRLISIRTDGFHIVNAYVPQGQATDSPKFQYKLAFLKNLAEFFQTECDPSEKIVLTGDFNVATDDRDVHDPEGARGGVMFHPSEHTELNRLKTWGLSDCFRKHCDEGGHYSWWDYRMAAFRRNLGWRLDYIFATKTALDACASCEVDKEPRKKAQPSDHAPVIARFGEEK